MSHDAWVEGDIHSQGRLLRTMAEELKLPLIQIARSAELARISGDLKEVERLEVLADATLRLLDSYVLSTQTMLGQQSLQLQPLSVSAVMYDSAQYLQRIAKLYDCEIITKSKGKSQLVMANASALQAALTSLGHSFISAISDSSSKRSKIILMTQSSDAGVAAGIQSSNIDLSSKLLQQARELYGVAHQPMSNLTHISGAGVLVAQSLFSAMSSPLKVVKSRGNSGFAGTLLLSKQLTLL